jgi:hypothetical protein
MNRIASLIGGALAALGVVWAGAEAQPAAETGAAAFTPVPPAVAQRLPRFCRYELDLSAIPHPHAAVRAAHISSAGVCPFVTGSSGPVLAYGPRGAGGCDARFPGLTLVSTREIDGQTFRRDVRCSPGNTVPVGDLPGARGGRAYLLSIDKPDRAAVALLTGMSRDDTLSSSAPPISVEAFGQAPVPGKPTDNGGAFFLCWRMLPGADVDALGFLREARIAAPAGLRQEEVTGRDCADVIRARVGEDSLLGGSAVRPSLEGEFSLWLHPTPRSPTNLELIRRARTVLARDGVRAARGPGLVVLAHDRELVARTRDGGFLALTTGTDALEIGLRRLTPETCRVVFDLAGETGLNIQTSQTDQMLLQPPGNAASGGSDDNIIPVADAADLCAMLRPGFEEWRAGAPALPPDLSDLDRQEVMIIVGHVEEPRATPTDAPK